MRQKVRNEPGFFALTQIKKRATKVRFFKKGDMTQSKGHASQTACYALLLLFAEVFIMTVTALAQPEAL